MEDIPIFVENLQKRVGKSDILNNISFTLGKGEWSGIFIKDPSIIRLFIKMLVGMVNPTSGRVYSWGKDVHRSFPDIRQNISYAGTILDYIPIGNKLDDIINFHSSFCPRWERSAEKKYCELFKLRRGIKIDRNDKYTISKLQILFAIAQLPNIVFIDGFHSDIGNEIKDEFFRDLKQIGSAILFVSNDIGLLEKTCNRFGAISDGTLKFWDDLSFIRREHRIVRVFSEVEKDIKTLDIEGILNVKGSGKLSTLTISKNYNFTIEMLKMEGFLVLEEENYSIESLLKDRRIV